MVGKMNFQDFLGFSDKGLPSKIEYNIPIFVCLMPLLSSGKWTDAARKENYRV